MSQACYQAFDYAFILIDAVQEYEFEDSPQGRRRQANRIRELAKDANNAAHRSYAKPFFSEYESVGEVVFPSAIINHGRRVQRANEQGQEQLGQRFKKAMKFKTSKWRTFGSHLRKFKDKDGEEKTKLVDVNSTATTQAFAAELLNTEVVQGSNHRIHLKKRMGADQARLKGEGNKLKRDHQQINPILQDDQHNTKKVHKYASQGRKLDS